MKPSFVTFALPIIALLAACGETPVHGASEQPIEIVIESELSELFEALPPVFSIAEFHDLSKCSVVILADRSGEDPLSARKFEQGRKGA